MKSSLRDVSRKLEEAFDAKAYLDARDHSDHGENWSLTCPVCEKEDKLWVLVKSSSSRIQGTWICFRCDDSGGPMELVRLLDGVDFFGALEVLKKFSRGVEREGDVRAIVTKALANLPPSEPETPDKPCFLPEEFVDARDVDELPRYFVERGISLTKARIYGLGFCRGGRYDNRLIVPVRVNKKLKWFLGRWMAKTPPKGTKKYLNSFGGHSSRTLFNFDRARHSSRVVLVEDVFSSMLVGRKGLATFGTHFSRAQLSLLAETEAEEVIICWDRDAIDKAWKLADSLAELWAVRVVELPDARDPDEMEYVEFWDLADASPAYSSASSFSSYLQHRLSQI